jgi:hypothetical protein
MQYAASRESVQGFLFESEFARKVAFEPTGAQLTADGAR